MVSICANPDCGKPLHYLRDGRIFIFDAPTENTGAAEKRLRHLEHYWLCGECSQTMILTLDAGRIKVVRKLPAIRELGDMEALAAGLAS